jgi:tRNA-modifying protein YgfZ
VTATGTTQLDALEEGRAFAELVDWRKIAVRGGDARAWLHDLVTADVEGLGAGHARRSLLLTPTGRIRADFHVANDGGSFLLLQAGDQPEPVDTILAPYVLSSDVEVEDRTDRLALFAVLGGAAADDDGASVSSPSVLGPGRNVVVASDQARRIRARLTGLGLDDASLDALESWRIRRGLPQMGRDFDRDSLPAEAGLEHTIDFSKGCFLGQESVAKVRNLGHPPRIVRHARSSAPVREGATVLATGSPVGEVTSAAVVDGATELIVRVRWEAAGKVLSTAEGPLHLR